MMNVKRQKINTLNKAEIRKSGGWGLGNPDIRISGYSSPGLPVERITVRGFVIWILSFFIFVGGCGYSTRAYVTQTGYRKIYIAPFENKVDTTSEFSEGRRFKSYFPLLENSVTNAVVDRFIFDGSLRSSKEPEADLILKGKLVNYHRESLRNSTSDTPEEFRITIVVDLVLTDNKTQKVVWEKTGFAGDSTYFTTGQFVKSESQALQDATKDLARRIVEATVEAW